MTTPIDLSQTAAAPITRPFQAVPGSGMDDRVLPFSVEGLDTRGRIVRLGDVIDRIVGGHGYPPAIARLTAEAVALTALLGSSLKFEGRFQIQVKGDGVVHLMVVDFDTPDRLRALTRYDTERLNAALREGRAAPADLLGHGVMALTVDQGADMARYQGVVALEGRGLEQAAHQYFRQSEQIPTRIRLAVAEQIGSLKDGNGGSRWRAGGLLAQFLPSAPERRPARDLAPGDVPAGYQPQETPEDDAWLESRALVETIEDHELVDPLITDERLLFRLFHERGVRVFEPTPLHAACRCSRDRILAMLRSFEAGDRSEMRGDDGRIGVTCEFCSTHYAFDPAEVEAGTDTMTADASDAPPAIP